MIKLMNMKDGIYIDLSAEKIEQVQKHTHEIANDLNICIQCNTKLIKNTCRFCGKE